MLLLGVIRIFGEGSEQLINRTLDILTQAFLASHHLGPRVIAKFANGYITEFIPGRHSSPDQRLLVAPAVARTLARWHQIPLPNTVRHEFIWDTFSEWMRVARESAVPVDLDLLEREVSRLRGLLSGTAAIGLVHGDLLWGNILFPERDSPEGQEAVFIDLEYAAPNPVPFDIANHWCEWAGFDGDYDKYPTPEQQREFLRMYLGNQATPAKVETLRRSCEQWALVSHLYWAKLRGNQSPIDYKAYGNIRLAEYWRNRNK
ncbi:putative Ethanolamine kinase 2 [Paratrimastix pyriformis]|uniref:ethanolamine kinase n=1 Tax=Paratrimastix pyriformis TaxID=342808 RepID=A0ABQ8UJL2_9EUKA|nr:putative Ethanolamine kinase 2 [Paratrimastix pyriformis]